MSYAPYKIFVVEGQQKFNSFVTIIKLPMLKLPMLVNFTTNMERVKWVATVLPGTTRSNKEATGC